MAQSGCAPRSNGVVGLNKNNKNSRTMETVKFKWVDQTKWNTLKHLGKPFTSMDEAIKFVRHNNTEWGLQLKLGQLEWDNF